MPASRFPAAVALALSLSTIAAAQSAPAQTAASHFPYDRTVPLNVQPISIDTRANATIQNITYTGAGGKPVPATLVLPGGHEKFAAILWAHWLMPGAPNANRSEFLDEAIALASSGVVSLLIDSPQARPGFKPTPNALLVEQQVVDLRRALDLLLARPDVDPTRIAFVGHSWNTGTGAILDALDKRLASFVFMSGPQSTHQYMLSSDSPRMAALRQSADVAKIRETLDRNAWADPATYAAQLGPAPALFQYGLHDEEWVPLADAQDFLASASGPKCALFYDSGHALNSQARADRDQFLREHLHLTSVAKPLACAALPPPLAAPH